MEKMLMLTFLAVVVFIVLGGAAYFFVSNRANPPLKSNQVKVGNAVFDVEVATTIGEKMRGLSFRNSLGENQGMLFAFDSPGMRSFSMRDMSFSLDIIWIGGGKVLGFAENAAPQAGVSIWGLKIYSSPPGTDRVFEVNAGTVKKENIKVGDAFEGAV